MALQKWAAPAGSPLLSTLTATGPDTDGQYYTVSFGAAADIAVGAVIRIHASGSITTTGAPTAFVDLAGFQSSSGPTTTGVTPSGVTSQPWAIEGTFTFRSASSVAYDVTISDLFATTTRLQGTFNPGGTVAGWYIGIGWDVGAADADSGDIITMSQADALWIG